jgi:outer membrane protein, heavy metal efflux system
VSPRRGATWRFVLELLDLPMTLHPRASRRGSLLAIPTSIATRWPLLGGFLLFAGCQSYERRPLELPGHRTAFLARTPDTPEVREFADALARSGGAERARFDLTDGLTCEEAEVVALVFNADLRLARLRAGVALANAENAGRWADPSFGLDLAHVVQSTPEPWRIAASVGLTLPLSGRLDAEKRLMGNEYAAELARVAEREWRTRTEIRRAWTQRSARDAELATVRELVERLDSVLVVVDRMEQASEMTRAESRLLRIERASKSVELFAAESFVREAELHLKLLMGIAPNAPVQFSPTGIGPAFTAGDDLATLDELEARSPTVAVALAEYEAAEWALRLEIRKQYPDLNLAPGYGREDGMNEVHLGLSLPLPLFNANRRGIAEARALRELARANAQATLEHLLAAAQTAVVRLDSARRQRHLLETEIAAMVDAQYADARRVAELGEVNVLVLLESLARQQEAKVKLIEARRDEALARIDLQEIAGPPAHPNPDRSAKTTSRPPAAPSERTTP